MNEIFENKTSTLIKKIIVGVILLIFLIFCIWVIPVMIANSYAIADYNNAYREFVYKYRILVLQLIAGITIIFGLYLTYRRIYNSEQQTDILKKNQQLEVFSKAIEQLASKKSEIRIAGLYLLGELSRIEYFNEKVLRIISTYLSRNTWDPNRIILNDKFISGFYENPNNNLLENANLDEFQHITKALNILLSVSKNTESRYPLDIRKIIITGTFNNGVFNNINFSNSFFINVNFESVLFEELWFHNCIFINCNFDDCNFLKTYFNHSKAYLSAFQNCDFNQGSLQASFEKVKFINIKFSGRAIFMNGAILKDCDLVGWNGYNQLVCTAKFENCNFDENFKKYFDDNCHQKNEGIEIDKLK